MKKAIGELCRVPKMSTFAIGAMINYGVSHLPEGTCFLNVGVWHGFSLLCAMSENPERKCIGVDNFSEFGGPRDAFLERFKKYKSPNHQFFDMGYEDYFANVHSLPIGFYFYDGDHGYENQLKGLQIAEPFFAENCLVMVDDTNWDAPRKGTLDFIKNSKHDYEILLDRTTFYNWHPTIWNGLMILQMKT